MPVISPIKPPIMVWKAGPTISNNLLLSTWESKNPNIKTPTIDKTVIHKENEAIKVTIVANLSLFILLVKS
jgi:hypothetical protein